MLHYFDTHPNKEIYKKVDCLCDYEFKYCIVNTDNNKKKGDSYQEATYYGNSRFPKYF